MEEKTPEAAMLDARAAARAEKLARNPKLTEAATNALVEIVDAGDEGMRCCRNSGQNLGPNANTINNLMKRGLVEPVAKFGTDLYAERIEWVRATEAGVAFVGGR